MTIRHRLQRTNLRSRDRIPDSGRCRLLLDRARSSNLRCNFPCRRNLPRRRHRRRTGAPDRATYCRASKSCLASTHCRTLLYCPGPPHRSAPALPLERRQRRHRGHDNRGVEGLRWILRAALLTRAGLRKSRRRLAGSSSHRCVDSSCGPRRVGTSTPNPAGCAGWRSRTRIFRLSALSVIKLKLALLIPYLFSVTRVTPQRRVFLAARGPLLAIINRCDNGP